MFRVFQFGEGKGTCVLFPMLEGFAFQKPEIFPALRISLSEN